MPVCVTYTPIVEFCRCSCYAKLSSDHLLLEVRVNPSSQELWHNLFLCRTANMSLQREKYRCDPTHANKSGTSSAFLKDLPAQII